jgi:hypothetical protein
MWNFTLFVCISSRIFRRSDNFFKISAREYKLSESRRPYTMLLTTLLMLVLLLASILFQAFLLLRVSLLLLTFVIFLSSRLRSLCLQGEDLHFSRGLIITTSEITKQQQGQYETSWMSTGPPELVRKVSNSREDSNSGKNS